MTNDTREWKIIEINEPSKKELERFKRDREKYGGVQRPEDKKNYGGGQLSYFKKTDPLHAKLLESLQERENQITAAIDKINKDLQDQFFMAVCAIHFETMGLKIQK